MRLALACLLLAPACRTGGEHALDLGEGERLELVRVEALDAWVGRHEVTNGQYRRFRPEHASGAYEGHDLDGDRQPVVHVSLEDARAFCRWLAGRPGIPAGLAPRLPTGEEWTALARCGDGRVYPWGDAWPPWAGNYADATAERVLGWEGHAVPGYDDGFAVSAPVDASGVNDRGLHGLGGNVWEWTEEPARDGTWRVLRGASWRYREEEELRVDFRAKPGAPWGKDNNVGFRVVLGPAVDPGS